MNKQELIKHFEEMEYVSISQMGKKAFIDLIEQLDEPQKVKVPQFVADWIEYAKNEEGYNVVGAVTEAPEERIDDWLILDNVNTFARAWLDGYEVEVEEEKQYYVRFKFIEDSYSYLTLIKHLDAWTLHSITLDKKFRTKHTKKQLEEAGFGEVFNSTLFEVKEAEEWY
nr:MAG TPA: Protein of unknown function (DUF1642) [Caudoviricetes sp.]